MKKLLLALFALVAGVSVAIAADLPSKKAAPAPAVSTSLFGLNGVYVGGYVGQNFGEVGNYSWDTSPYVVGGVAGYQWNSYFRTEATFDYTSKQAPTNTKAGETVFANAVVQYPVGFGVTPYLLAGAGLGWNAWGKGPEGASFADDAKALYNVGGGVRYELTKSWELDARYRYINAYSGTKFDNSNIVTFGTNYKF
jgi:outer membrane immunogenic protein